MKKRKLKSNIKYVLLIVFLVATQIHLHSVNQALLAQKRLLELSIEDLQIVIKDKKEYNEWIKPCNTSSAKSYMLSSAITSTTSKQYELVNSFKSKDGLLLDEYGHIAVALGSWFGDVGSRWVFELSSGEQLYVIKADEKDDSHVVDGCVHKIDTSVIEFIVDINTNTFEYGDNGLILNGNFNNHKWFNGDIIRVKEVHYD